MSYWVVDANIAVNTVLDITDELERFWERVDREQMIPCAPRFWLSETTSAIRFFLAQKELTSDEAEQALRTIHRLRVELMNEDDELSLRAVELAEKLVAEFWTTDERLVNHCRKDLKLDWVHSITELS